MGWLFGISAINSSKESHTASGRSLSQIFAAADPDGSGKLFLGFSSDAAAPDSHLEVSGNCGDVIFSTPQKKLQVPGVDAKKPAFFWLLCFQVSPERLSFWVRKVGGKPMVTWVPRLVAKKDGRNHCTSYDAV